MVLVSQNFKFAISPTPAALAARARELDEHKNAWLRATAERLEAARSAIRAANNARHARSRRPARRASPGLS